jgi:hypothetical protein
VTTVRLASAVDVPGISRYLATILTGGPPARYRRFLEYTWLPNKPDAGVVIEEGDQIHGYIGAIYSERSIGGSPHAVCNLTSVAVDESHRRHTLSAFAMLLKRKDLTFSCFSPSDRIAKILDFFKFQHRPGERVVVPITRPGLIPRMWPRPGLKLTADPDQIEARVDAETRRIVRDHRSYRCAQILLERGSRHCHIVAVRRGRGRKVFAEILHASDREMFLENLACVQWPLLRKLGTILVGIDRRWAPRAPRISMVYRKLCPTYVRSPVIGVDDMDFLYSEFVPMYG